MIENEDIIVNVICQNNKVFLKSDEETIEVHNFSSENFNQRKMDFAVWFFLPIAMRQNRNIRVKGLGSNQTCENAHKMSEIWEAWAPERFSSISVSFEHPENYEGEAQEKTMCFYSGGVDSTYSLLRQYQAGNKHSLLTVHGMDYQADDKEKFDKLTKKTDAFASLVGNDRLFVKSNIYSVYKKYGIDVGSSHVTHIFALTGISFLFSEVFSRIYMSADHRLDQQFAISLWGSNSCTNNLFNDGSTRLITIDDDVTRIEKLPSLTKNETAINSLTFCTDYNSRPENCGKCGKCMRTKMMFYAINGFIPKVFTSMDLNSDMIKEINLSKANERAFFIDLYQKAKNRKMLEEMPYLEELYDKLKHGYNFKRQAWIRKKMKKIGIKFK